MIIITTIIAPIFAIVALGVWAGRSGYLTAEAGRGIADFAFNITIPALLFRTILQAQMGEIAPVAILASFFGAAAIVWILSTLVSVLILRRPVQDAPSIAMASVFGNTIMLGLPIGLGAYGPDALAPISVILAIHAPVFLASAAIHAAFVTEQPDTSLAASLMTVMRQLTRQPFILAIVVATLWRLMSLPMPGPVLATIEMLAKAGVPAALIALGIQLARFEARGDVATLSAMMILKLVVMPLCTAALGRYVFDLSPLSLRVVTLMAALPAGANAYLFAVKSGRVANSASAAVAIGTAVSALTLTAIVALLHE